MRNSKCRLFILCSSREQEENKYGQYSKWRQVYTKAQEALRTCDEHEHEELSCFCKTCEKFICTKCAKTTHIGHDWDLVSLVAKKRRKESPILCRKIKQENMPRCREKLRTIDSNISTLEKESDEDLKMLEDRRIVMISIVNQIIDEMKRKREESRKEGSTKIEETRHWLVKKIQYLEKMTTSLESNIDSYSDFDVIEMELEMLTTLSKVESFVVTIASPAVKFLPGEINKDVIETMIGRIEETTMTIVDDRIGVKEMRSFKKFDSAIYNIALVSSSQAWTSDVDSYDLKLLSLQDTETKMFSIPPFRDLIRLSNGDFVITDYRKQVIRQVSTAGKVRDIVSTKPLHPSRISKTHTDNILVAVYDDGDKYKLQPSSRRLVHRMTLKGKVLNTYEFREDGITRLFTFPGVSSENGNSDICVINRISDAIGEVVVLHSDGRMRFTYRGLDDSIFDPMTVECDSETRIIVLDRDNKSLHLLNPDGTFLRHLLSNMFDKPRTIALYHNNLWIGFVDGTVKVYKYNK